MNDEEWQRSLRARAALLREAATGARELADRLSSDADALDRLAEELEAT